MVLFGFVLFQAEDGIRDLVRSRGLGDVYKRQEMIREACAEKFGEEVASGISFVLGVTAEEAKRFDLSLIHI